mgnify:CR=1 FL=1
MRTKYKLLFLSYVLLHALSGYSQGINSPYSRYGFGVMADRAMGFNKGMGGVAYGFGDGKQVNVANPASYSSVDSVTALFDMGMSLSFSNYKMDKLEQNAKNTSIDYFAFQFRAAKGFGITFGLQPITNINYSFSSKSQLLTDDESYSSSYSFAGDGGLHEVFLGMGVRLFKPLSIGVNAGYIWGTYNHTMKMSFNESSIFSLQRKYDADVRTYDVSAGMQIAVPFGKKDKLTLGLTYGLGHNIDSKAFRTTNMLNSSNSVVETKADTLKNAFQLPHTIGAGLCFNHDDQFRIGADFTLAKWADTRFPSQDMTNISSAYISEKGQLNDSWRISLGGDFVPKRNSTHLFGRTIYRLGGYYSQPYAKADASGALNAKPYEMGISAGVGIPIDGRHIWYNKYNVPRLNISLQFTHSNIPYLSNSQSVKRNLTENYVKLCIGITFNERWFYKWKVQ